MVRAQIGEHIGVGIVSLEGSLEAKRRDAQIPLFRASANNSDSLEFAVERGWLFHPRHPSIHSTDGRDPHPEPVPKASAAAFHHPSLSTNRHRSFLLSSTFFRLRACLNVSYITLSPLARLWLRLASAHTLLPTAYSLLSSHIDCASPPPN